MSTNSRKLSGKVAIVTGASKGIGASIAKYLAAEDARVAVNCASSKEGADQVVARLSVPRRQLGQQFTMRPNRPWTG
jgi:NAD(P)-dependent dehydrogenase (short-subunit alcohol dehydrogenase family)